jgi:hypothetical protein
VIHELSENGTAEIHPTLSAMAAVLCRGGFAAKSAEKNSNRKIQDRS